MSRVIKPGSEAEQSGLYGMDWIGKGLATDYFATTDSVTAGFAICATSQHPQETLKFLQLLHTDPKVFNLLAHGIEDKHWQWTDRSKNLIGFLTGIDASSSGYNPAQGWMWGNQFLEYYTLPGQVGAWDATKKINDQSVASAALGFTLNPDPIKTELAQLSAVHTQYGLPLETGLVDPATALPEYQAKLKEAGLDKVVTEIQNQLTAWKATKTS
jgi:putative aldouronate transport system substrate-binding protein